MNIVICLKICENIYDIRKRFSIFDKILNNIEVVKKYIRFNVSNVIINKNKKEVIWKNIQTVVKSRIKYYF